MKIFAALLLASATLFSEQPRVLLFSGSTRKESFNKKLIAEAARIAKSENAQVSVIDLGKYPIPHYDGDLESQKGMPQNAQKLRQEMIQSDVIVISTPQYNASISGVLKDALDWASRGPTGDFSREAYKGKTFVLLSASPSRKGGLRAVNHLKEIVKDVGGTVCEETFSLGKAHEAFDSNGRLKDLSNEAALKKMLNDAIAGKCAMQKKS